MKKKELYLKICTIIVITTLFIILGMVLDFFSTEGNFMRQGWAGGSSKYGYPGETVFFNFTVESYGGSNIHTVEIKNIRSEIPTNSSTTTIVVHPGEKKTISITARVPPDAINEDWINIRYDFSQKASYGYSGHGEDGLVVIVTNLSEMHNKPIHEEVGYYELGGTSSGTSYTTTLDLMNLIIITITIILIQIFLLFIFPRVSNKKKEGKIVDDRTPPTLERK